jgi:hypothetical protein
MSAVGLAARRACSRPLAAMAKMRPRLPSSRTSQHWHAKESARHDARPRWTVGRKRHGTLLPLPYRNEPHPPVETWSNLRDTSGTRRPRATDPAAITIVLQVPAHTLNQTANGNAAPLIILPHCPIGHTRPIFWFLVGEAACHLHRYLVLAICILGFSPSVPRCPRNCLLQTLRPPNHTP